MAKVLNKRKVGIPAGAVYIGRPSKWGNPFVEGKDGTRAEVIAKYTDWLWRNERLLADLHELRGKDLVCWCAPQPCHGDVLLELANHAEVGYLIDYDTTAGIKDDLANASGDYEQTSAAELAAAKALREAAANAWSRT